MFFCPLHNAGKGYKAISKQFSAHFGTVAAQTRSGRPLTPTPRAAQAHQGGKEASRSESKASLDLRRRPNTEQQQGVEGGTPLKELLRTEENSTAVTCEKSPATGPTCKDTAYRTKHNDLGLLGWIKSVAMQQHNGRQSLEQDRNFRMLRKKRNRSFGRAKSPPGPQRNRDAVGGLKAAPLLCFYRHFSELYWTMSRWITSDLKRFLGWGNCWNDWIWKLAKCVRFYHELETCCFSLSASVYSNAFLMTH